MEHLDYTELRDKLDQLDEEKARIEKALAAKRNDRRKALLAEFKVQAEAEGFSWDEFCGGGTRKGRRTGSNGYPVFVDNGDDSKTYVRGPLPRWMQENMASVGLDPKKKPDRERYKTDYMHIG